MASVSGDQPTVRLLTQEELYGAAHLVGTAMLGTTTEEITQRWATIFGDDPTHGALTAKGELAGVARWFREELSLDGGSAPAAAVTAVGVATIHRRQGHLTRLMHAQLQHIADAEVPIALLVAAEWPIYGRFGYGPAIDACAIEIDSRAAVFLAARTGSIELVSEAELRPHLEAVHNLRWERTMGAITRAGIVWDHIAGVERWPNDTSDAGKGRGAIWRDEAGQVQGAVRYTVKEGWTDNRPSGALHVHLLVGATPAAERELWRHLCEVDWTITVKAGDRSIDDPVRFLFTDGRVVVQRDMFDCIWARMLDVPRVLSQRRAPIAGGVVAEVVDPLGHASGRFSIEIGPDGAEVTRTDHAADLRLPIGALSAASLGGRSLTQLQHAGQVDEERAGGVARLDALLRSPIAPWSPTTY